jgi:hypothetical protein
MILFHLVWVRPGDVRDGLAPTQVFSAVPSLTFSVPAELTSRFIDIARKSLAPPLAVRLSSSGSDILGAKRFPRRPIREG